MTLLWTLTALFLYLEMAFCLILVLPLISVTRWRSWFRSRLVSFIASYANFYFALFLFLLGIMLIDSIREIRRFSGTLSSEELRGSPLAENTQHMKLFRAQRNFYIAGFSIFLFIILRRLIVMINNSALMEADCQAVKKQATSASAAAKMMMDEQTDIITLNSARASAEKLKLKESELEELAIELKESKMQQSALKSQADNNNREYDRLQEELSTVQEKLECFEVKSQGKKAD